MSVGASFLGHGTHFRVWAPRPAAVDVEILAAVPHRYRVRRDAQGYGECFVPGIGPGARYQYRLHDGSGQEVATPDPASRCQPEGVHGPSEVVAMRPFAPATAPAIRLSDYVLYELHVGTFTAAGSFDAAIADLPRLRDLGITAIELMPVAQFPGARNWGYDGAYPYAAQASYGGPAGLARLVDAIHARGMAAVLDVVYNHLGPEGNYLARFGPYFTSTYQTPWGEAINFDGPDSDPVRRFFVDNALWWLRDLGFDGLRLDAIHGILDRSAEPFLADLSAAVEAESRRLGRPLHLIAESDLNDVRVLRPRGDGGFGLPAQWSDDFHHAAHVLLTGERQGYYQDFAGVADLATAVRDNFVYAGRHSRYRRRRHGNSAAGFGGEHFVVFLQNHDQTGNRPAGERLSALVDFERQKLAAGLLLFSPFIPLLFMGEEYGETAPFPYFIEHGDAELVEAVRRGRAEEFRAQGVAPGPDPQAPGTFATARLRRELRQLPPHAALERLHRELLRLRSRPGPKPEVGISEAPPVLALHRDGQTALFHFGAEPARLRLRWAKGPWAKVIDSAAPEWLGPGSALPARLESKGEIALDLPATAFALYQLAE